MPLTQLEQLLGDSVPTQYREFLDDAFFHPEIEYAIDAVGHHWSIDEFFTSRSDDRDIALVYESVKHAIPPGAIPILSTLGGLLLIFGKSRSDPNVYYWDHEQDLGMHEMKLVASSANELRNIIVEDHSG